MLYIIFIYYLFNFLSDYAKFIFYKNKFSHVNFFKNKNFILLRKNYFYKKTHFYHEKNQLFFLKKRVFYNFISIAHVKKRSR